MKPRSRPGRPPPPLAPVPPSRPQSFWRGPFGYVAVLVAGFAAGAVTTWRFVRDDLESARRSVPSAPPAASAPASTNAGAPPANAGASSTDGPGVLARANGLYDEHRWADAAREYERAIALGQDNADVRTDLANCYRFLNQPERAIEGYRLAQVMDPRHENSLYNLGTLYQLVLRDRAKANETLRLYLARFPASANSANARKALAELESAPPEASAAPTPVVTPAASPIPAPSATPVPLASPKPVAPVAIPVPAPSPATTPVPSPTGIPATTPSAAPAPDAVRDWLERRAAPSATPSR